MAKVDKKMEMASWLQYMMDTTKTRNYEIIQTYKDELGEDVSQASMSNMRSRGMSADKANEIADLMGWDKPFVVNGRVVLEGISELGYEREERETSIVISSLHPVAGVNSHNNEYEVLEQIKIPTEWLRSSYPNINNLSNLALCSISGDSMEPTFKALDTVLVDTTVQNFDYDGVFVFTYHNTLLIKRVQTIPGTGFRVKSDNARLYESFDITVSDVDNLELHGRVVGNFSFNKV